MLKLLTRVEPLGQSNCQSCLSRRSKTLKSRFAPRRAVMGFLTRTRCKKCDTNHIPLATAQSPLTARLSFGINWRRLRKKCKLLTIFFVVLKEIRHQNTNSRRSLARISVDHDQTLKPDCLQIKSDVRKPCRKLHWQNDLQFRMKRFFFSNLFPKNHHSLCLVCYGQIINNLLLKIWKFVLNYKLWNESNLIFLTLVPFLLVVTGSAWWELSKKSTTVCLHNTFHFQFITKVRMCVHQSFAFKNFRVLYLSSICTQQVQQSIYCCVHIKLRYNTLKFNMHAASSICTQQVQENTGREEMVQFTEFSKFQ